MDNGYGHSGFAWNEIQSGAEYGTTDVNFHVGSPTYSTLYSAGSIGTKRKLCDVHGANGRGDTFLALGLGCPSSSSDNSKSNSATVSTMSSAKEATDEGSARDLGTNFQLHISNVNTLGPKSHFAAILTKLKALKTGPTCGLQLSLSTGSSESVLTDFTSSSAQKHNSPEASLLTMTETRKTQVSSTLGVTHSQQRNTSTKTCQFQGCVKGARGASGLCIAHGGGRRCQKAGCHRGAEGRTVYCKAHGGGRRCQFLGCTKSAEGRTDFCIAHGGGRHCSHDGCIRAARGKSGLCIRHGGGKRCHMENCTKSAEGYSGLCISHGGGRRCQFPQCTKGAQGSTMYCKAHGGGKRCTALGCTKGAEGSTPFCKGHGGGKRCSFGDGGMCPKSVHGGTQFCVAHGGGKRCVVAKCTKSARGRTDYCVRHGGGKRCKYEGCGKSAQGSTDFCKAHGGGKKCSWVHGVCERFAQGSSGLCTVHGSQVQDHCVGGGGTMGFAAAAVQLPATIKHETENMINSMILPEGRVHGGNLLAFLSSNAIVASQFGSYSNVGTSKQDSSNGEMHHWM